MPCQDFDFHRYGPSPVEVAQTKIKKLVKFINYVNSHLGRPKPLPNGPKKSVHRWLDVVTAHLCAILTDMSTKETKKIVYNPYDRTARNLADWWEDHQEADRMRLEEEKKKKHEKKVKKAALAKLTKEERKLLNL